MIKKPQFFFLIIVIFLYWFFLPQILNPKFTFWTSDAQIKFFPSTVYLAQNLSQGKFPFWSERVFLGYPIYEDIELGYLNPINILFSFIFSPNNTFKAIHFLTYLIGCYSLYLLFEKYKFNYWSKVGSVIIFYFSFFHLNHLAHPNMVFTTMLLPVHLILVEIYIRKPSFRNIFLQGILFAYSILWGQFQIVILNFIVTGVYTYFETRKIKPSLSYIVLIFILSLAFSMHQLYPTFNAYISSYRSSSELKYSDFHNFPLFLITNFFPFIFGYFGNYQGVDVSAAFSFIESYNYLGIIALLYFFYYLLYGFKDKNFNFIISVFLIYLLISFINLPLLDSFRYWTRSVYLFSLALSFSFGYILSNKFSGIKPRKSYILILFLMLLTFQIFNQDTYFQRLADYLFSFDFKILKKETFFVWVALLVLSLVTFRFKDRYHKYSIHFEILIVFLLLIDFKYFSLDFINYRVSRFTQYSKIQTPLNCKENRCLIQNTYINGYESLYYSSYSPLGYSQFISKDYLEYFNKNFFDDPRKSVETEYLDPNLNLAELEKIGFKQISLNSSTVEVGTKSIDILPGEIKGNYLSKSEGNYLINIDVPRSDTYFLGLKYSSNWQLYLDDRKIDIKKNGLFSEIDLKEGIGTLKIYYFPYDILYGSVIGAVLLLITYFLYTLFKNNSLRIRVSGENI